MLIKLAMKILPRNVLSQQARKPSGLIGRFLMTNIFNAGNADLNTFVKEMLEIDKSDSILEVGFGPGKLIAEMADSTPDGQVAGIDFSATMLRQAEKTNVHHIQSGRVKLHQGECRELPFADDSFDKLCSINTLYFWDKPEKYLSEMLRVLKPQGKIIIGFHEAEQLARLDLNEAVFQTYSQAETVNLLLEAGFNNTYSVSKDGKPLCSYCAIGSKN